ncbi:MULTISPECIES: ubiquinone biosynthesis accessory factor UbiJ [unclassified Moraxella]|uniref:ubiquinone biosynthesis accessory factor UbiJ n=1 Tax=unclassified Moraxella TaxID=2685852 RepID=UPI003AF8273A
MFTVLLLAGVEKIVNLALATDPITQAGLQPLTAKSLRLVLREPNLQFDTIFNDNHIRFEPVSQSVFEPKGTDIVNQPNCTVTAENPNHLLYLMGEPQGNLPIEGDYKVLMQVKTLMAGFDPDIIGKLQPIIGLPLASQLTGLIGGMKQNLKTPLKDVFADIAEMADWKSPNHHGADEHDALKQQLLKLRADVEREQAKLEAIKQEQAKLMGEH